MSDTLKIGQLITDEQQRDAVHMAIVPVVASQKLLPGEHVSFAEGKAYASRIGLQGAIGIVDPFLKRGPGIGDKFWLFLYPGSITSLRHDWTHPAFPGPVVKIVSGSRLWMENFAEKSRCSYDEIIYAGDHGYINAGMGVRVPDEFWVHFKELTGRYGTGDDYFSCSC